jgi:dipeptidyl-peptidase 4
MLAQSITPVMRGAALLTICGLAALAPAQTPQGLGQMLERLYGADESSSDGSGTALKAAPEDFKAKSFGPLRWLDSGQRYAVLQTSSEPGAGKDIVRCETASGQCETILGSSELHRASEKPLAVSDFAWSSGDKYLLVFANAQKVWRQRTRGEYWVYIKDRTAWRKLGGDGGASDLMFAKFSPDGSRVAYVRNNNIYVEGLPDGPVVQLTRDGSATTINGTSDWVYEEEFSLRDGFLWSPDGQRIAYWQFDTTGVPEFTLINYTDSLYPVLRTFPYPKTGQTNSAVRIGVVPATGGPSRFVELEGDSRSHYIPRMNWAGNSRELLVERLNRLQNTNEVLLADADTGAVRRMFRDQDAAWSEVVEEFLWAKDGRELIWTTESDGWKHAYAIARDGGARLITTDAADVMAISGVDSANSWLYSIGAGAPTERYLYRTPLDGGKRERVTPAGSPGWHSYEVAPNCRWAVHTFSRFNQPPVTELVRLPEHQTVRVLEDNSKVRERAAHLFDSRPEFFQVDVGDGVTLDGWMIRPGNFDPAQKYPVIVHVYGEPAGVTVTDSWSERNVFHCALANEGYLVVSFDNRGTPAPKGRAWRRVIYGSVGVLSSKEQAAALRTLASTRPYIDLSRVGVWGWSGGGSNTLNLMFRVPELYKVGVAVAPVPDQRLYDSIYQERYMGLPAENAEGYRAGSPINFAEGLAGKLLVVHGTGDDNVHFQGTQRLINRLVELGKPFDFMEYPNRTHSIDEGKGTELHVYSLIARYIVEHLPAGGRPQ